MTTDEAILAIHQAAAKVATLKQECATLAIERDNAIAALAQVNPDLVGAIGALSDQLVDIPL